MSTNKNNYLLEIVILNWRSWNFYLEICFLEFGIWNLLFGIFTLLFGIFLHLRVFLVDKIKNCLIERM